MEIEQRNGRRRIMGLVVEVGIWGKAKENEKEMA